MGGLALGLLHSGWRAVGWFRGVFIAWTPPPLPVRALGGGLLWPGAGRGQQVLRLRPEREGPGRGPWGLADGAVRGRVKCHRTALSFSGRPCSAHSGALLVGLPWRTNTLPLESSPFSLLQPCPASEASSPHDSLGRRGAGNGHGSTVLDKGTGVLLVPCAPASLCLLRTSSGGML